MKMEKYYVVKKGSVPGIYQSLDDCLAQVVGYPGAEFQIFDYFIDAEKWYDKTISKKTQTQTLLDELSKEHRYNPG